MVSWVFRDSIWYSCVFRPPLHDFCKNFRFNHESTRLRAASARQATEHELRNHGLAAFACFGRRLSRAFSACCDFSIRSRGVARAKIEVAPLAHNYYRGQTRKGLTLAGGFEYPSMGRRNVRTKPVSC